MKKTVEVHLTDHEVAVRYDHGDWLVGMKDARWLPLLGAIAEPEKHTIVIKDKRENRQEHQKDLSCERTKDTVANLINAMAAYGMGNNWSDGEIIYALIDCGVTKEDFKRTEHWDFIKSFFEESESVGDECTCPICGGTLTHEGVSYCHHDRIYSDWICSKCGRTGTAVSEETTEVNFVEHEVNEEE